MSTIHQDIVRVKGIYQDVKYMGEDSNSPTIQRLSNRIATLMEDAFGLIEAEANAVKNKGPYI